jgi:hypothetical protein
MEGSDCKHSVLLRALRVTGATVPLTSSSNRLLQTDQGEELLIRSNFDVLSSDRG